MLLNNIFSFCRGDLLNMSYQLLYHVMTLLKSCTEKAFELVIDLTQATQLNEPDVSPTPTYSYQLCVLHQCTHAICCSETQE